MTDIWIGKKDTRYRILIEGLPVHNDLTEEEYFDTMEDLSIGFYETGFPHPDDITTELIED